MPPAFSHRQVCLTLSGIAYVGFYNIVPDDAQHVREWVERLLQRLAPVGDEWQLVWGPAVYRFPYTWLSDNVIYVVRHRTDDDRYIVVIRGTNPLALSNWVFEDFLVRRQVPWRFGAPSPGRAPKVSWGTSIGLGVLQDIRAGAATPGRDTTLKHFLLQELAARPGTDLRITITGHSLGGVLAPALALWLHDTQGTTGVPTHERWDPDMRAHLDVVSIAGPTPGNADFAHRFDNAPRIQSDRVANTLDLATRAWSATDMHDLDLIYRGAAILFPWWHGVWRWAQWATRWGGYTHVRADIPPFQGDLQYHPLARSFIAQAVYQHSIAYLDLLDLREHIKLEDIFPALGIVSVSGPRGPLTPYQDDERPATAPDFEPMPGRAPNLEGWRTRPPEPPWR